MSLQTVTMPVTGMSCVNCANNIDKARHKENDVQTSITYFAAENTTISFDPRKTSVAGIAGAICAAGHKVPQSHPDRS